MSAPRHMLVTTHTGEPLQPTRLRFRVARRVDVERVLCDLRCVFRDASRPGVWLWHYSDEAEGIDLPKRTSEIATELQPVVLADLNFSEPRRLTMRFRSPDRAIAAARFFCPRFGQAAVLDRARILNRLAILLGDRDDRLKRDVPEVEDFPVDLTVETSDFMHLNNTLRFRLLRAFEHWKGRPITLAALIHDALENAGVSAR